MRSRWRRWRQPLPGLQPLQCVAETLALGEYKSMLRTGECWVLLFTDVLCGADTAVCCPDTCYLASSIRGPTNATTSSGQSVPTTQF